MDDRQSSPGDLRDDAPDEGADHVTVVHDLAPEATDPDLHRITWLAAYSVGLSLTRADDRTCVDQLLDVQAHEDELRGAHGMLAAWDMADAARHRRALQLIERALRRTGKVARARPSAPPEHRWVTEWSH